jgi:predicted transcriptional regulator
MKSSKTPGAIIEEFKIIERYPCYLFSDQGRILSVPRLHDRDLIGTHGGAYRLRSGSEESHPLTIVVKISQRGTRFRCSLRTAGRYKMYDAASLIAEAWTGECPKDANAVVIDPNATPLLGPQNLVWRTKERPRRDYGSYWHDAVKAAGLKRRTVDYEQVRALSSGGKSDKAVATHLATSPSTVGRAIGARSSRRRIDVSRVLVLWHGGMLEGDIANEMRIARASVYRILNQKITPSERKSNRIDHEEIRRLWRKGISQAEIVRALGYTTSTVSRVVRGCQEPS